jgi:hypothetical protein
MSKPLYKLFWYATPLIFLFFYAVNSKFCIMFSCTGNNTLGLCYGIGAVIIYCVLLKSIKILDLYNSNKKIDWRRDVWGANYGFLYMILILLILLTYFLGKINREEEYAISSYYETPYVSS